MHSDILPLGCDRNATERGARMGDYDTFHAHASTWVCLHVHAYANLDLVPNPSVLEMCATHLCVSRRLTHPRSIQAVSQVGIFTNTLREQPALTWF